MSTENNVRRGYVRDDEIYFSEGSLPLLRKALSDICELLNRGYELKSTTAFVGDHYQLYERQRAALARAAAADVNISERRNKMIKRPNGTVFIDGFNIIISLETALSGTTLYRCADGTVRDLASLRGNYRVIGCTQTAINLILEKLSGYDIEKAVFYLDAPVSNSGRLKTAILKESESYPFETVCELVPNADTLLKEHENVITADAVILDECKSWINFVSEIIEEKLPDTKIIGLAETHLN